MPINENRIALIKRSFERDGNVMVSNGQFRGYTTFKEFEEFARSSIRNQRRIAANILRKAKAEYPGPHDSDEYRRYKSDHLSFNDSINYRWIEYSLPLRFIHNPEKPRTVEERMRAYWLRADKHPLGLFGIEIEFASEQKYETKTVPSGRGVCDNGPECCPAIGPIVMKEVTRPLPSAVYKDIDAMIPGVHMKTDSSIRPAYSDAQEANLLAGPNGFLRLKKLCKMIKERGGIINQTCSVHVHLDARQETRRVVGVRASKLWDFMPVMQDLVPRDRLTNKYCLIEKPSFDSPRRLAINLQAYEEHKTIEVRLGGGSLNPSKIWHWANLLLLVSKAKGRYKSWDEFLTSDFPLHLRVWCVHRANEIAPDETLRKKRINTIVPGLDDVLQQEYGSEDVDSSAALKGTNV